MSDHHKTCNCHPCLIVRINELRAEVERLRREIEVLRRYGNNDCTRMADAALEARDE